MRIVHCEVITNDYKSNVLDETCIFLAGITPENIISMTESYDSDGELNVTVWYYDDN